MNRILVVCLVALTLTTSVERASATQPVKESNREFSFVGTWKGTINDLPGIDLTISKADKGISGHVVFYLQERADLSGPWKVTAEYAVPLLTPQVAGKILTFEVEHHVCHGCAELGPNVTFKMELAGANNARLTKLEENGTEDGPQMALVRYAGIPSQQAPPWQSGITVKMPPASSAASMPGADQEDALIVTVTRDGKMYVGVRPVDPEALNDELRDRSFATGPGKTLYLKADARASYAAAVKILDAATRAGFEKTVLLTNQNDSQPGLVSVPKGFTIETQRCAP